MDNPNRKPGPKRATSDESGRGAAMLSLGDAFSVLIGDCVSGKGNESSFKIAAHPNP
jgi:hypothetical protein